MANLNFLHGLTTLCVFAISWRHLVTQKLVECDVAKGWLQCKDDPSQCVRDENICDGISDCIDATDEVANGWAQNNQCLPFKDYTCPDAYLKCHTMQNTGCLSKEYMCDGEEHCQDHKDELNCPNVNFQLSSSTVLGVFIFALLIFTVTLCIAVLGVYATNKARSRRRRAAQRQEEQRSRLRNVFSLSGNSEVARNGVDNPNYEGDPPQDLVAPPPYALVVEAELLEAERRRQNPESRHSAASSSSSMAKPPSYEDIFGGMVSMSLDPSRAHDVEDAPPSSTTHETESSLPASESVFVHSPLTHAIADNTSVTLSSDDALAVARQPSITISAPTENDNNDDNNDDGALVNESPEGGTDPILSVSEVSITTSEAQRQPSITISAPTENDNDDNNDDGALVNESPEGGTDPILSVSEVSITTSEAQLPSYDQS